jgi:hypothetical protein
MAPIVLSLPAMSAEQPAQPSLWSRLRGVDLLTVLVIGVAGLDQLVWMIRDQRMPRDPGLYYKLLPQCYTWLGSPVEHAGDLLGALVASSGWYNLLLAVAMRVFGRSGALIELACLCWVVLVLVGTARVARRLGTPLGALCAVLLVSSMPLVMVSGRTPWIHLPEAALMLALVLAWQADAALARWSTVAKLAVVGALLLTLRHSGLVWLATIAPLLLFTRGQPRAWRRIGLVLLTWGIAAVVPAMELQRYMTAKMDARQKYVDHLPGLYTQLSDTISRPVLWICLVGLFLLLLRKPRLPREPIKPLMVAWVLVAVLLWALFRAGMDNFTPLAPGLAILAGLGLARTGAWGAIPALLAGAVFVVPQWLPFEARGHPMLAHTLHITVGSHPLNWYIPWRGFGPSEVQSLLEASCPKSTEQKCVVVVDHGLLLPFAEDPGALELFLMGADHVQLVPLRGHQVPPRLPWVHALSSFDCMDQSEDWRERYQFSKDTLQQVIAGHELQPVWTDLLWGRCGYLWMTPEGELVDSEALPTTGHILARSEGDE